MHPNELFGEHFQFVLNKIDNIFENAMHQCFLEFQSITEPILSHHHIADLVNLCKTSLLDYFKVMKQMLGFHRKENRMRNMNLKDSCYYDRILFY